jgi:hypothetical protein
MKYHSVVLHVWNIDRAKKFYCELQSIPIESERKCEYSWNE